MLNDSLRRKVPVALAAAGLGASAALGAVAATGNTDTQVEARCWMTVSPTVQTDAQQLWSVTPNCY
ncbi:hypothetical protein ABT154_18860 [Streptomyces sp. NPDC001728]|uniref:hypothetical protein n=1 Tax=Streptomyces sp. NPDC001728 TaxID=3154396 RepID=UPI003321F3D4